MMTVKTLIEPLGYHKGSEKYFTLIFMATKYRQMKLEMTWAKIDTKPIARHFYAFYKQIFLFLYGRIKLNLDSTNINL